MYPIYAFGSEAQKLKYLPGMAKGEIIACFGLTDPHGGSDPANMKTHARRQGKDWVLNDSKMWITNGSISDVAVVWAMTDDGIRWRCSITADRIPQSAMDSTSSSSISPQTVI